MKILLLFILILFSLTLQAASQDLYGLANKAQLNRFHELTASLRCVVCQNQSLADSNSPLAKDMRSMIAQKIIEGEADQAIVSFLEQRYGNFVSYRPPLVTSTYLLWGLPILILCSGIFIIRKLYLSQAKQP